jgi:hypothetical protein
VGVVLIYLQGAHALHIGHYSLSFLQISSFLFLFALPFHVFSAQGDMEMRLRSVLRLAVFFFGCVLCFLLDGVGAGVAMWRMPNAGKFPPVQQDIVHELIPFPDVCVSEFLTWLLLAELVVVGLSFLLHSKGVPVIVAAGISTSLLSVLRAFSTWPTVYFSPDPSCINCGRSGGCPATLIEAILTTLRFYPVRRRVLLIVFLMIFYCRG